MLPRISLIVLALVLASTPLQAQIPDFDAALDDTVAILQDLVRLDTSNPPGNETLVAEYAKKLLEKEGIPGEIYALDPARGNLVARLEGNGSKRPILIMGHSDVVGVDRDQWTLDPFQATIKDGFVYGRGAADYKGMIAAAIQMMLMIKRANIALDRDIILLIEAGEEGTTQWGIDYMVEHHLDKIDAEFALNEGGDIHIADGRVDLVKVTTAEKAIWRGIKLIARGVSGHGSRPRPDNAVVHIAEAVAKLGRHQMPMRLNETTREYFKRMAEISPPDQAFLFANIEDPVLGPIIEEKFRNEDFHSNSYLRTGISPNIITGGFRYNVIPGEAEATLDVRALPDENQEEFLSTLARVVDDPAIEIVPPSSGRPAAPPSPLGTDLFRAIEKVQSQMFPGAITLPTMSTGASDSAQLRAAGVPTYGIGEAASDDQDARAHGNDERVSIEGLGILLEFMYRTVLEVAASN